MSKGSEEVEKAVEFMTGELGDVTLALRPCLPILAEGYRIDAKGYVQIFGQGRKIGFHTPEDVAARLRQVGQLLLCEFSATGDEPERELILGCFP